jgi:hypothetical protein
MNDIQHIQIKQFGDIVTNVSEKHQSSNTLRKMRGWRNTQLDGVLQRDSGTLNEYSSAVLSTLKGSIYRIFPFWNKTTNAEHYILFTIDPISDGNDRFRIYVDTSTNKSGTFEELSRKITASVSSTPSTTTNQVQIVSIQEDGVSLGTPASSFFNGFICYNATRGTATYVTAFDYTTQKITGLNYFGSDGLSWQAGDSLIFFRTEAFYKAYRENTSSFTITQLGTTPHLRFNESMSQRKVTCYIGNSDESPTMQRPFQIMYRDARNYFPYTATPLYELTIPARWDIEAIGGGFAINYSVSNTLTATTSDVSDTVISVYDQFSTDLFMKIKLWCVGLDEGISPSDTTIVAKYGYMTLIYSDYQESDPIYRYQTIGSTVSTHFYKPSPRAEIWVNPASINKEITGVRFYVMEVSIAESNATLAAKDVAKNYHLVKEVLFRGFYDTTPSWYSIGGNWAIDHTTYPEYSLHLNNNNGQNGIDISGDDMYVTLNWTKNPSINDELRHAIITDRVIQKPKFGITMMNSENAIAAILSDDRTILYSTLDGDGVVEDDNFTIAGTDIDGNSLSANLLGSLPVLGMLNNDNFIDVFRQSEKERVDGQGGNHGIEDCDFYSQNSLVSSPEGLFWTGKSNIYFIPIGNSSIYEIGNNIKNLFDGTLKNVPTSPTAPVSYVSDSARQAIVGGWDEFYKEYWFHIQVVMDGTLANTTEYLCYRYSPTLKRMTVRQLAIGLNAGAYAPVLQFFNHEDGSLGILYGGGVLKYPNLSGTYQYTDDVPQGGASTGNGIPTSFYLNLGEISDKFEQNSIISVLMDSIGSSISGTGQAQIDFYANGETTAFDTQYFGVDIPQDWDRKIRKRGKIGELAIKVSLPYPADIKKYDISTIYLGMVKRMRLGNI